FYYDIFSHISVSLHVDNSPSDRRYQFYFKDKRISRNYFSLEFYFIHFNEIRRVIFRIGNTCQDENSTRLRQSFYLKNTRHYRFFWKMAYKEWLIKCYIFQSYHMFIGKFQNFIDEKERIPVRHQFHNSVNIENRFFMNIDIRNISFLLKFPLAVQFFSKLGIHKVAGFVGNHFSSDFNPYQCKIANDVQK